jgi:hypothetical protein
MFNRVANAMKAVVAINDCGKLACLEVFRHVRIGIC